MSDIVKLPTEEIIKLIRNSDRTIIHINILPDPLRPKIQNCILSVLNPAFIKIQIEIKQLHELSAYTEFPSILLDALAKTTSKANDFHKENISLKNEVANYLIAFNTQNGNTHMLQSDLREMTNILDRMKKTCLPHQPEFQNKLLKVLIEKISE